MTEYSIYSLALTRHVELFLKSSGKPRSTECYSRMERVAQLGARRAPPHYMETDAVTVRYFFFLIYGVRIFLVGQYLYNRAWNNYKFHLEFGLLMQDI